MMAEKRYFAPGSAALAPMAGVTDMPFRTLCFEQGCDYATTEMVSARGFFCAYKKSRAVRDLIERAPGEGDVAVQIFGHEPEIMAEAARILSEQGFCAVDINMGCPAPKIVGNGDGSALLKDLAQAKRVITAVRAATRLPLTVKMRLGWDDEHFVAEELARIAEGEGVDGVTVHGRTRTQFYSGKADWEAIARVCAAVRIPVVGNGDISTAEEGFRRMRETGCTGVSIGRGATGNPWIFARFARLRAGLPAPEPTDCERIETAMRHARMLAQWKDEAVAVREMRKHAAWYTRGMYGAAQGRPLLYDATTLEGLQRAFDAILERAQHGERTEASDAQV